MEMIFNAHSYTDGFGSQVDHLELNIEGHNIDVYCYDGDTSDLLVEIGNQAAWTPLSGVQDYILDVFVWEGGNHVL